MCQAQSALLTGLDKGLAGNPSFLTATTEAKEALQRLVVVGAEGGAPGRMAGSRTLEQCLLQLMSSSTEGPSAFSFAWRVAAGWYPKHQRAAGASTV